MSGRSRRWVTNGVGSLGGRSAVVFISSSSLSSSGHYRMTRRAPETRLCLRRIDLLTDRLVKPSVEEHSVIMTPGTPLGWLRPGRIQVVVATRPHGCESSSSLKTSEGVLQLRVFRGRRLSVAATAAMSRALCLLRSVPLGKYWRSRPLVFSFVDRCHGLRGSQKNTCSPLSIRSRACWAISAPWSQVSDRRSCSGSVAIVEVIASRTASAPCPARAGLFLTRSRPCSAWRGRWSNIVNRVVRSTNVPIAELPSPMMRSPSQCPGTARSSTSGGRFLIRISGPTNALPRPRRRALGTRSACPVRRQAVSSRRSGPPPLDIQRLVDSLVRDPHRDVIGILYPEAVGDLLRAP